MSANSSFSNDSVLDKDTVNPYICFITSPGLIVFSIFYISYFTLLLPLCTFIVHFGFQQLKGKASAISHSDSFTYHIVGMEMIGVVGCVICFCGNCLENKDIFIIGIHTLSFTWYGQIFFHILTCAERYLAVVYPITYLNLRNGRGIRIRNITIGCVWLVCSVGVIFETVMKAIFLKVILVVLSPIIISFCSLTVLCVLIRPAPGDRGEGRARVDKSKLKAFYTIMTILGILVLRLFFGLIWAGVKLSGNKNRCIVMACGVWINLPSSLVLPLLFLQRAGKLKFK